MVNKLRGGTLNSDLGQEGHLVKNNVSWSKGVRGEKEEYTLTLVCVVAGNFSVTGASIRERVMMSDEAGVIRRR